MVIANQAMAFPRADLSSAVTSTRPRINHIVHPQDLQDFEELIGRRVTSSEINQIQRISDQTRALNEDDTLTPQKVRWDLGNSGYEFTVLICGQFKLQADTLIPKAVKDALGKLPEALEKKAKGVMSQGTGELMPCFDPHTSVSYVMVGGSQTFGAPSILTTGLSIGIYFSEKSEKMIIGSYLFGRFSWNLGGFGKWDITGGGDLRCVPSLTTMDFDFSKCTRFFISTGLGFDLGGALFSKLKAIRKQADAAVAADPTSGKVLNLGTWSFSWGVIVKINEFPWYERMRNGAGIKEAFSDLAQYTK